jgi:hypothetical protein
LCDAELITCLEGETTPSHTLPSYIPTTEFEEQNSATLFSISYSMLNHFFLLNHYAKVKCSEKVANRNTKSILIIGIDF